MLCTYSKCTWSCNGNLINTFGLIKKKPLEQRDISDKNNRDKIVSFKFFTHLTVKERIKGEKREVKREEKVMKRNKTGKPERIQYNKVY